MIYGKKRLSDSVSRAGSKPQSIGTLVDQIISRFGLASDYYGWRIVSQWPEIVGEHYARRSRAFRFDSGTVYVAVPDASWRQMMSMDTPKILEIIHRLPYGSAVKQLRLVWGDRSSKEGTC